MTRPIDADELLKIYANRDNVLGVTLQPVGKSEGCKYVELDKIKQFPIRRDHYDRENGDPHYINGIESVMEYIGTLPAVDAEPVIRCKNCKHWDCDDSETYCDELGIFGTDMNSYCSYAKRK